MVNKRLLVGVGGMLVGGILVVAGLLRIPVVPVVLIILGGAVGFIGYKIYDLRGSDKPKGLEYGGRL